MATITKTFCDVCKIECNQEGFGQVIGKATKMNPKGELVPMIFGGDYCEEHFLKIAEFIGTLNEPKKQEN